MSNADSAHDLILRVDYCFTPRETIHNASILCRSGLIQAVGGYSALRVLEDIPSVDLTDCWAVPGLIDTHIHGSNGFGAMEPDSDEGLAAISTYLATHGVGSFVLTVLSAPQQEMLTIVDTLAAACERRQPGASLVGLHLEGPYLNPAKAGAQSESSVRPVDLGEAAELVRAAQGRLRTMTFAPELPGSDGLIELLGESGVTPSMGHSLADEERTRRAVAAGARRCTHVFNGMPSLDQRHGTLTAVALTDDHLTIELIVDGRHVHPRMIDLACRSKPKSQVVAVSDAVQGTGLPDGTYRYGGQDVIIEEGTSRRASDGKLAGAVLSLDEALRNVRDFTSLSDTDAVACVTQNAAQSVGLDDRGVIQPGKRADLTILDADWRVVMTMVDGRIVFDRRQTAATE